MCCGIGKKDAPVDLTAVSTSSTTVASTQENVAFETVANHAFYQRFADHALNAADFEFHFQAKGLDSAHVAFLTHATEQSNVRDDNCLEIVIGGWGNTQSLIRVGNQGRVLASQTTRNFMSATEMQSFWACMRNGVLSVGRGRTVGAMEFMSARVPTLSLRTNELHVGFASWENNVTYMYTHSSSSHHRAVSQHRAHAHHHPHRSHHEAVNASHVESSYSTSLLIGE